MSRFLVLGFEYKTAMNYCLVKCKPKKDHNEYAITIMNGCLEGLLHGNHIILEMNGCLQLGKMANEEQFMLKECVAKALGELLELPLQKTGGV